MKYWERIIIFCSQKISNYVSDILFDFDSLGLEIIDLANFNKKIIGYFECHDNPNDFLEKLNKKISGLSKFGFDTKNLIIKFDKLKNDNWENKWEKYYKVERITHDITVVPSWIKYISNNKNEKIVYINPNKAFGSGTHPTTKLAIQSLEFLIRGNEIVSDVGTGSGILSIISILLGAKKVYAYDNNKHAIESSKINIKSNLMSNKISIIKNNLLNNVNIIFDIIVANMLYNQIKQIIPQALSLLKTNGYLILSGLINKQVDDIKKIIENLKKFRIVEELSMDNWFCFIIQKMDVM